MLGDGAQVNEASSGGFSLKGPYSARLVSPSSPNGRGIILDDSWSNILEAGVHFIPDGSIPTDETGARHRTAERMAAQTGKPVIAVSEGRKVATLFYGGQKIELASPTGGGSCQPGAAKPRSVAGPARSRDQADPSRSGRFGHLPVSGHRSAACRAGGTAWTSGGGAHADPGR